MSGDDWFRGVSIWIVAIGRIIGQVDNILSVIGYGGGFAAGKYCSGSTPLAPSISPPRSIDPFDLILQHVDDV